MSGAALKMDNDGVIYMRLRLERASVIRFFVRKELISYRLSCGIVSWLSPCLRLTLTWMPAVPSRQLRYLSDNNNNNSIRAMPDRFPKSASLFSATVAPALKHESLFFYLS